MYLHWLHSHIIPILYMLHQTAELGDERAHGHRTGVSELRNHLEHSNLSAHIQTSVCVVLHRGCCMILLSTAAPLVIDPQDLFDATTLALGSSNATSSECASRPHLKCMRCPSSTISVRPDKQKTHPAGASLRPLAPYHIAP